MKRLSNSLLLLALGTLAIGCNETISPELQNAGSSTTVPGGGGTTTPKFYFKLEQTSAAMFRYKMHKTGQGNRDVECKIEEPEFSTSNFSTYPSTFDITCFLEAEEQTLYYNGIDLKLSASPDICETVVYAPYNFFQHQPGSSARSVELYKCNGITSITNLKDPGDAPYDGAGCDQAVETSLATGVSIPKYIDSDQDLCDFDYSNSGGPNCDEGTIAISEITYSVAPDYCANAAGTEVSGYSDEATCEAVAGQVWTVGKQIASVPSTRFHSCGGSLDKCRAGVGLKTVSKTFKGLQSEVEVPEDGKAYTKEITLSAPNDLGYLTNMSVANYVRQCSGAVSNSSIDNFGTSVGSSAAAITAKKTFVPHVLDRYSLGINYWSGAPTAENYYTAVAAYSSQLTPRSTASSNVSTSSGMTRTFYAADSFMTTRSAILAKSSIPLASTNPYYAFYCLNNSLDIKARIRLVVREWDQFPDYEDQDFELLSDIFYQNTITPQLGRMDTAGTEVVNDSNPFNDFNDVKDWDDFLRDETADTIPGPNKAMNNSCSGPATGTWYASSLFTGFGL